MSCQLRSLEQFLAEQEFVLVPVAGQKRGVL